MKKLRTTIFPILGIFLLSSFSVISQDRISEVRNEGNSQRHIFASYNDINYLVAIDFLDSIFIYEMNGLDDFTLINKNYFPGSYGSYNFKVFNQWILTSTHEGALAYDILSDTEILFPYDSIFTRSSWRTFSSGEIRLQLSSQDYSNRKYELFTSNLESISTDNFIRALESINNNSYLISEREDGIVQYSYLNKNTTDSISSITFDQDVRTRIYDHDIYYVDKNKHEFRVFSDENYKDSLLYQFPFEGNFFGPNYDANLILVEISNQAESNYLSYIYFPEYDVTKIFEQTPYQYQLFDQYFCYSNNTNDVVSVLNLETGIEQTLSIPINFNNIIHLGGSKILYGDYSKWPLINTSLHDIESNEVITINDEISFNYSSESSVIEMDQGYLINMHVDAESVDDLFIYVNDTENFTIPQNIRISQRGISNRVLMNSVNGDISVISDIHIYGIDDKQIQRLDEHEVIKNFHSLAQYDSKGLNWAERNGKYIEFYRYQNGERIKEASILDDPLIDLELIRISEFVIGEKYILMAARIGFDKKSFLLNKETGIYNEINAQQSFFRYNFFYHDGWFYHSTANSIVARKGFGITKSLNFEIHGSSISPFQLYNNQLYVIGEDGVYKLNGGEAELVLESDDWFSPVWNSFSGLLILRDDKNSYTLKNGEWITIAESNTIGYHRPFTEEYHIISESTGINTVVNTLYHIDTDTYITLPEPISQKRINTLFTHLNERYLITHNQIIGNITVEIYKISEDFQEAELVQTINTQGRGLGVKFKEYNDEGLLAIGDQFFLLNDQLEFIHLEGVTGDHNNVYIEEQDGTFYFFGIDQEYGRQVYSTVAFSKRETNTKELNESISVKLFPNPTNDLISLSSDINLGNYKISIINNSGMELPLLLDTSGELITLDLKTVPDGLNYIKLTSKINGHQIIKKVVKLK